MKKPKKQTLDIIKELIQNNHKDLAQIGLKFNHAGDLRFIRRNIKRIIDRNKILIREHEGQYHLTEKGKKVVYDTKHKEAYLKDLDYDIHKIEYAGETGTEIDKYIQEYIEHIAQLNRYQTTHAGFNGSILHIHDPILGVRFSVTTRNRYFIHMKENVTGYDLDSMMQHIQKFIQTVIPKIEKKYKVTLKKGDRYDVYLHSRHIASVKHPFDTWCRRNKIKIHLKDEKTGENLLILDHSQGYDHFESESTKRSKEAIEKTTQNLFKDAIDGFSLKENSESIDRINKELKTQEKVNMTVSEALTTASQYMNENLKMQTLLIKETMALKWLKKHIKKPEDVLKHKDIVLQLNDYEKRELEEYLFSL